MIRIINFLFFSFVVFYCSANEILYTSKEWMAGGHGDYVNRQNVELAWYAAHIHKPAQGQKVLVVFARKIQQEYYNAGLDGGYLWSPGSEATPWSDGGNGGPCLAPEIECSQFDTTIYDPLIIDLSGDEIHLGNSEQQVLFDLFGDGNEKLLNWVSLNGNEAFLAMDNNRNGIVDDGSELFGYGSNVMSKQLYCSELNWLNRISNVLSRYCELGELPKNGFVALSQYDSILLGGDGNGIINSDDHVWSKLILWLDINADGQSSYDEMATLDQYGLIELSLDPKLSRRQDKAGNYLPLWSWAAAMQNNSLRKLKLMDAYFRVAE